MMISAWLVRSGLFEEAGKSLAYFSDRRTDKKLGNKSQGVETPSQSRYVIYYERLLTEMGGNLPPPVSLSITKMTLKGILGERLFGCVLQISLPVIGRLVTNLVTSSVIPSFRDHYLTCPASVWE